MGPRPPSILAAGRSRTGESLANGSRFLFIPMAAFRIEDSGATYLTSTPRKKTGMCGSSRWKRSRCWSVTSPILVIWSSIRVGVDSRLLRRAFVSIGAASVAMMSRKITNKDFVGLKKQRRRKTLTNWRPSNEELCAHGAAPIGVSMSDKTSDPCPSIAIDKINVVEEPSTPATHSTDNQAVEAVEAVEGVEGV